MYLDYSWKNKKITKNVSGYLARTEGDRATIPPLFNLETRLF